MLRPDSICHLIWHPKSPTQNLVQACTCPFCLGCTLHNLIQFKIAQAQHVNTSNDMYTDFSYSSQWPAPHMLSGARELRQAYGSKPTTRVVVVWSYIFQSEHLQSSQNLLHTHSFSCASLLAWGCDSVADGHGPGSVCKWDEVWLLCNVHQLNTLL